MYNCLLPQKESLRKSGKNNLKGIKNYELVNLKIGSKRKLKVVSKK